MKIGHMLQMNRATPHGWRKLAKTRKKYSLSRVPSATFELFFARYFFSIFSLYIYSNRKIVKKIYKSLFTENLVAT